MWKHKVYGKSFSEFQNEISFKPEPETPVNVGNILKDSFDILNGFNPYEGVN